jgi:long-chain acyl-CoA synthetase
MDERSARECPGLGQARQAANLADLLLASPLAWNSRPLLRSRRADGLWTSLTRGQVQQSVLRIAAWLQARSIRAGDRVGILSHNKAEWLMADFAILAMRGVTVPAYFTDPAEAVAHVFHDAGVSLILVEPGEQQQKLAGLDIPVLPLTGGGETLQSVAADASWDGRLETVAAHRDDLATLIYTSGTTGLPKGVMLTHDNLLSDVAACIEAVSVWPDDVLLSFLPVSHAFERTVGQFLPVAAGGEIAYAEGVSTLMRDITEVRPTVMISVPRLYEKIYAGVYEQLQQGPAFKRYLFAQAQRLGDERRRLHLQGGDLGGGNALAWRLLDRLVNAQLRQRLGGRLRLFVSGGAALNPNIARFLLAAGITVLPGYGLTEAAPVLSVNREQRIKPETVGPALPGIELKLSAEGELLARGPVVMEGYWQRPLETAEAIDEEGWLHTGDKAVIDGEGYVRIVDRAKEIMVLSNGENVPPAVVEQHLAQDPCVLQAMIVADGRDYVAALIVPEERMLRQTWESEQGRPLPQAWRRDAGVRDWMLARMALHTHDLASYMQVQRFVFVDEEWTQESGLLTPTLKLKRRLIVDLHTNDIERLYAG